MTVTLPSLQILCVLVGLVLYLVPLFHPKLQEIGRIMYFVGLFGLVVGVGR